MKGGQIMASVRKYKCPFCSKSLERTKLASHIDKHHDDMLNPDKGYTANRIVFDICNKKEPKSDKKKRTILYKEVYLLNKKLNEIYTLLNNENETENKNNEQFKLFKNGSFLDYDDDKDN